MSARTATAPTGSTSPAPPLDVRPTSGHLGAEIHGVDLAGPLDDETIAAIRAALLRWKVVFFRDQRIGPAEQIAFGRRFGEVTPAHPTLPAAIPEHPEILVLDSEENRALGGTEIASLWHTDVTFVPNPPMGVILRGVEIPPYGGDTQWLNLAVAYERLSQPIKDMIDGLHAVHENRINVKRGELASEYERRFRPQNLSAVHPLVRVHPETGERILFVNPNFTSHVVELSRQESRHLLAMLYEHMTDHEFTTRFRWQPGSVAFWDNRATAHVVPTDVPADMRRTVHRISLAGDVPVGLDGERSRALEGSSFQ